MQRQVLLAIALSASALHGMACGKRTVPFKRDNPTGASSVPDAGRANPTQPPRAQSYAPLTQQIELGGRQFAIDLGAIRASLELPAKDAEPTLLVLLEGAEGSLTLEQRKPDGQDWKPAERVALLIDPEAGDHCSLDAARLSALTTSSIAADADLHCVPAGAAMPPSPTASTASAGTGNAEHRLWAVALDPPEHVIEAVATSSDAQAGLTLTPALEHKDLDGDGRLDLLLRIEARIGAEAPLPVELKLFDRAGGLIRDGAEPEKTLRQLAENAVAAAGKHDPSAESLARTVLLLHRSLCREPGAPKLLLGGRALECGASLGAGRAASVLTAELAHQGKLLEALDLSRSLQQSYYQLGETDTARVQQALRARAQAGPSAWREAIRIDPGRAPPARHSALGFIDDAHVLIRGSTPRSYDLAANRADPVGITAGLTLVDPSGRFAVGSIKRSCEGYHLSIVRASQVVAGILTGPSVAEPLFVRAPAPPAAHCPDLSTDQRRDQGGYHVIEWTAAGVVIARDQALLLLAVDSSANASEPARALSQADSLPTPTYSGEFTPDARYQVWLSPEGVAVRDRTRDVTHFVAAPPGSGAMTDVAISPSGRVLALLRGGQLLIAALDAPPPPPP